MGWRLGCYYILRAELACIPINRLGQGLMKAAGMYIPHVRRAHVELVPGPVSQMYIIRT